MALAEKLKLKKLINDQLSANEQAALEIQQMEAQLRQI
jgi:hypothetical protein